jgi:predicted protein tyrosine phosphatase
MKGIIVKVTVLSYEEAVAAIYKDDFTHVLTLLNNHNPVQINNAVNELKLNWKFVEVADVEHVDHPQAPTQAICKDILDWGTTIPEDSHLLVHCAAGVSRSTSSALALMVQKAGNDKFSINSCAKELIEIRSMAYPNMLFTKYYDDLLQCDGYLIKEVKYIRG